MPVPIEDRYKVAFEHHRFVSEYRLSILKIWGALYVALAALFVWTQSNVEWASWVVAGVAMVITVFMWLADWRHRPAIGVLKDMGKAIEQDPSAGIPQEQHYFTKLEKGISHSWIINVFALSILLLLLFSTVYLFRSGGKIPTKTGAQQVAAPDRGQPAASRPSVRNR